MLPLVILGYQKCFNVAANIPIRVIRVIRVIRGKNFIPLSKPAPLKQLPHLFLCHLSHGITGQVFHHQVSAGYTVGR